jgi:hypothetical protein
MATNPLRGIILEGRHFKYEPGTYRRERGIKNTTTESQDARRVSQINGLFLPTHSLTLILESNFIPREGDTDLAGGATTWKGVSRLYDLEESVLGGLGVSMPIVFVDPAGLTHNVVPTGGLDVSEFLDVAESDKGVEYKVSITLENIE